MRAKELKEVVGALIKQNLPIFIWGSPGVGKSSIVKQVSSSGGLEFIDLRLSLLDPTDLKGIPFFNSQSNEALWASPNFLPKSGEGILFLDEINTAAPSVQAAAYQLILDRKVGEYELPIGWAIVAAGNYESDRGVVYKLPTPLANRFVHLSLEPHFEDWKEWAYKADISSEIIAFLHFDNEELFKFDPTSNEKAFATPRSWEYVDRVLKSGLDRVLTHKAIKGAVGESSANNFISFIKVMSTLPNISDILDGVSVEIPKDAQSLIALTTGIVAKAKDAKSKQLENIINFSLSLPKEFAIMLIKDIQSSAIEIEHLSAFENWVDEFSFLLE